MRSYSALLAAFLIVLLATPAAPVAAGTTPSAGPDVPPVTFNVVRLALYPTTRTYDAVAAVNNHAFLADNHYDSTIPPDSWVWLDEYDVIDPQNPHGWLAWGGTGKTFSDMDVEDADGAVRYALAYARQGWESSASALDVTEGDETLCGADFDYYRYGYAYSVALDDLTVWVGVSNGLVPVSFEEPVNEQCDIGELFSTAAVYDIAQVGTLLYLGQYGGVRVVNIGSWPPSEVAFYPTPHPAYHIVVSSAHYIYAATDYGLDIIDGASGQIVTHYGPNDTVAVSLDGAGTTAYVGTENDLQVLDVSDPKAPKLIGDYVDPDMDFERSLAFDSGLVHSPKGIFKYSPELWLEAQSAGVAVNGTPRAVGSSVALKPRDRITLSHRAAAALKLHCLINSLPEYPLFVQQNILRAFDTEDPDAVVEVLEDANLIGAWGEAQCKKQQLMARIETDPPALPLSLVTGGVQIELPATTGAVKVDTTNASSRAAGGTTFQAGHNPTAGVSQFLCLAGTLQVQPTAAGAPLLTLGLGQFVDVTAAGAGPVGQLRTVYLPLLRR
jgi:hypothetical protein